MAIMKNANKKNMILIAPILLVIIVIISVRFFDNSKVTELSLESLKSGDEYCYEDLKWGMSKADVKKIISYKLQIDTSRRPFPDGVIYYKANTIFVLDDQNASVTYAFQNDKLEIIKFNFHLNEDYMQWFEKQVNQLTKFYGSESQKMENVSDQYQSIGYKWETENTTLQLIMMTGSTINPSAVIGIGIR